MTLTTVKKCLAENGTVPQEGPIDNQLMGIDATSGHQIDGPRIVAMVVLECHAE